MENKMIEANLIGFSTSAEGDSFTTGYNPITTETLPGKFPGATNGEISLAVDLATSAFVEFSKISGAKKATFLNAIADEIMNLGDKLVQRCCAESGLPEARIKGERGRTVGQLQMFGNLLDEGSWLEATIDTAQLDRSPVPKPDIRRMLVPMGPVAVFAASNFPLAFSTAGGDTASALAGGNPVIVKAHGAHPGTSALVGSAIVKAAQKTGMPDGIFSLLHGSGSIVGQSLIKNKNIKAAGFTGSQTAGRILYDLANQRKNPIPFFAEMGSINPVLLLPSALNGQTAKLLAGSITMGVGQFCTNPGLILAVESDSFKTFMENLGESLSSIDGGVMLSDRIANSFNSELESALNQKGITIEAQAELSNEPNRAQPTLASVSGETFLDNPKLAEEIFGPYSLVVKCQNKSELNSILQKLDGQLTGSVIGDESEFSSFKLAIDLMKNKVGRIIFNGVPTGVEVCPSMQHGGPYPASSDSRFTSVGTAAIKRFVRPVAYQTWPDEQLTDELKNQNPLNIWRLVDNQWTKDSI
jgi:NADP-dependent aldehyde dehydrogenase